MLFIKQIILKLLDPGVRMYSREKLDLQGQKDVVSPHDTTEEEEVLKGTLKAEKIFMYWGKDELIFIFTTNKTGYDTTKPKRVR